MEHIEEITDLMNNRINIKSMNTLTEGNEQPDDRRLKSVGDDDKPFKKEFKVSEIIFPYH